MPSRASSRVQSRKLRGKLSGGGSFLRVWSCVRQLRRGGGMDVLYPLCFFLAVWFGVSGSTSLNHCHFAWEVGLMFRKTGVACL